MNLEQRQEKALSILEKWQQEPEQDWRWTLLVIVLGMVVVWMVGFW
jgi:hypothetical protein